MNTTVMQFDEDSSSFVFKINKEYQDSKTLGYEGSFEDFLAIRDYT